MLTALARPRLPRSPSAMDRNQITVEQTSGPLAAPIPSGRCHGPADPGQIPNASLMSTANPLICMDIPNLSTRGHRANSPPRTLTRAHLRSATYHPFGGVHVSTGTLPTNRFPGQWFQSESGLHQNWMRDYDGRGECVWVCFAKSFALH